MKYFVVLILFVSSNLVFSQELVTDRPDQTESASIVPKGMAQIEAGATFEYFESNVLNSDQEIDVLHTTYLGSLIRIGVSDRFELRIGNSIEGEKLPQSKKFGIGDLELGGKVALSTENIKTAFLAHAVLPVGNTYFSNEEYGIITKFALEHDVTESFGLGYNVGFDYMGKNEASFTYSVAAGFSFGEKLGAYMEVYGDYTNENFVLNYDNGLTYLILKNLQADLTFGTQLHEERYNFFAFGLTWRLPE